MSDWIDTLLLGGYDKLNIYLFIVFSLNRISIKNIKKKRKEKIKKGRLADASH